MDKNNQTNKSYPTKDLTLACTLIAMGWEKDSLWGEGEHDISQVWINVRIPEGADLNEMMSNFMSHKCSVEPHKYDRVRRDLLVEIKKICNDSKTKSH